MKKIIFLLCLTSFLSAYSQENETTVFKKNELKGNALFLVAGAFEGTYERLLSEESGIGVSLFVSYDDDISENFSVTPYYRFYFGKKPAAGFFVEGFGMLNSTDTAIYTGEYNYYSEITTTDFALGFGLGAKWITAKGFVFEINGGAGRNLFNSDESDYEIVGRGGITLGYRF